MVGIHKKKQGLTSSIFISLTKLLKQIQDKSNEKMKKKKKLNGPKRQSLQDNKISYHTCYLIKVRNYNILPYQSSK